MLSSKHNMRYFKKFAKNKCVYDCEIVWDCVIVWLIVMKIGPKMKNGSLKYDMNRTRARHGNKCTKYEMRFSKTMVMCNKQHLSKIWSKSHGKVKQHWGWVEKKRCLQKKACILKYFDIFTGKNLCWNLLDKVAGLKDTTCNFKKRLQHRCLPVNIANILRTRILKNICERMLLKLPIYI